MPLTRCSRASSCTSGLGARSGFGCVGSSSGLGCRCALDGCLGGNRLGGSRLCGGGLSRLVLRGLVLGGLVLGGLVLGGLGLGLLGGLSCVGVLGLGASSLDCSLEDRLFVRLRRRDLHRLGGGLALE